MSTSTRQDQARAVTTVDPTAIKHYQSSHGDVALGVQIVREMFCPGATDIEAALFVEFCKSQQLNPFVGDVFLVKYEGKDPRAAIIVGKQTFLRRATEHPEFDGFEAGIIVQPRGGTSFDIEGEIVPEDCVLTGGWSHVYRKNHSRPAVARVPFQVYNRDRALWKSNPAAMIRKVAMVHALREAFPATFTGLTDAAETRDTEALATAYGGTVVGAIEAPVREPVANAIEAPAREVEPAPDEPGRLGTPDERRTRFYETIRSTYGRDRAYVDGWLGENLRITDLTATDPDDLVTFYQSFAAAHLK